MEEQHTLNKGVTFLTEEQHKSKWFLLQEDDAIG